MTWWYNPSLNQPLEQAPTLSAVRVYWGSRGSCAHFLGPHGEPEMSPESHHVYRNRGEQRKQAFLLATSKSISGVEQKPLKHSHDSMPSPQMTNDRHAGSKGVIAGKDPFGILLTVTTPRLSLKDLKAQ